ncbi:D-alanyl-D-alanine carboxypeptidase (penicillin-binding protein 5/6) [Leifsonia sp. AK011]|uniref:D-alanyl-D-alanine carboxypeptidase family protein n=1 Tax=Leifsonia sp. AK011 TaxID=2723075 RepID=UPI0017F9C074|nr:D-alanyl-D-alanine carboxypeptidase [Leifsonia sp. AK011]NYF10680.1 D-alanyl-D-alanine carboxypeptidase (penicillin-binding protein 5/6) [Leifsonia sp. AK011]
MPQTTPALTKKQIYRRRRITVFTAAALVLAAGFYLPLTLLAPAPTSSAVVAPYSAIEPVTPVLSFPPYGAAGIGAVGYDGVLARSGTEDALPIASISKVVTALVVLDAHPLQPGEQGPSATFGPADEQFYAEQVAQDGIVAPVAVGQTMSERNMLDLALMASANNYAQSAAAWAFGSEAAYVEAAAAWLGENGLTGTTITDATGIQPTNTSTVTDLIALAKLALDNPVVAEIAATASVDIPGIGLVENRNGLLGIDGVDGIKTGTLDESGACLLFSADHMIAGETVTLVGVVLGGPDHDTINAAIRTLLAEVDQGFRSIDLATQGQVFGSYSTAWGDASNVVASEGSSMLAWSELPITADIAIGDIHLATAGTEVGSVRFTVGDRTAVVPLVVEESIDDPGPWWRLGNPGELF